MQEFSSLTFFIAQMEREPAEKRGSVCAAAASSSFLPDLLLRLSITGEVWFNEHIGCLFLSVFPQSVCLVKWLPVWRNLQQKNRGKRWLKGWRGETLDFFMQIDKNMGVSLFAWVQNCMNLPGSIASYIWKKLSSCSASLPCCLFVTCCHCKGIFSLQCANWHM